MVLVWDVLNPLESVTVTLTGTEPEDFSFAEVVVEPVFATPSTVVV